MQSEKEFLSSYRLDDYERPSLTADIAAFTIRSRYEDDYRRDPQSVLSLLLIKRGGHPFKDHWALPGGFLQPNETIEACALREIKEETNISPVSLMSIGVFSEPNRDPRGWIISNAFASVIGEDEIKEAGGDDASEAVWFDVSFEETSDRIYTLKLTHGDTVLEAELEEASNAFGRSRFVIRRSGSIAFDHAGIIACAISALRNEAKNFDTIFDFLPEKFTLTSLQRVQETIMNISVLPANFRRKISGYVIETNEYTSGAGHRPAKLFMKK